MVGEWADEKAVVSVAQKADLRGGRSAALKVASWAALTAVSRAVWWAPRMVEKMASPMAAS
jgi:hypothetical protein